MEFEILFLCFYAQHECDVKSISLKWILYTVCLSYIAYIKLAVIYVVLVASLVWFQIERDKLIKVLWS